MENKKLTIKVNGKEWLQIQQVQEEELQNFNIAFDVARLEAITNEIDKAADKVNVLYFGLGAIGTGYGCIMYNKIVGVLATSFLLPISPIPAVSVIGTSLLGGIIAAMWPTIKGGEMLITGLRKYSAMKVPAEFIIKKIK